MEVLLALGGTVFIPILGTYRVLSKIYLDLFYKSVIDMLNLVQHFNKRTIK